MYLIHRSQRVTFGCRSHVVRIYFGGLCKNITSAEKYICRVKSVSYCEGDVHFVEDWLGMWEPG